MKILLTGATGFLGSHLAECLTAAQHYVRCLVRPNSDRRLLNTLPNIEFCEGDLMDANVLRAATHNVDAVVHAAGLVKTQHLPAFESVNVQGTAHLLDAVRTHAPNLKRFLLISSLAATGPARDGQAPGEVALDACRPVSAYGRSKLRAEQVATTFATQLPITIIRPPLIYGPRDRECLAFFRAVKYKVMPFFGSARQTASSIYAPDAATACLHALTADVPSGTAYFISDGTVRTARAMFDAVAGTMQKKIEWRPTLTPRVLRTLAALAECYGRLTRTRVLLSRDKVQELLQPHWICDTTRAMVALRWQPTITWEVGVQLTYQWYKKAGWL